jgi:uncharacterized protein YkwD
MVSNASPPAVRESAGASISEGPTLPAHAPAWRSTAATLVTTIAVLGVTSVSAADVKRGVHAKPAGAAARAAHAKRRHVVRRPRPRAPLAVALPASRPATSCPGGEVVPTPDNVAAVAATVLCLVDRERAAAGLRPLAPSPSLVAAASRHSLDMVANDYFGHASGVSENIAAGTGDLASPAAVVGMWMNSPGHRANILGTAYRTTGIGVVAAVPTLLGDGGGTYTEDFAP